jgi:uncharacterized membrane protein YfcA
VVNDETRNLSREHIARLSERWGRVLKVVMVIAFVALAVSWSFASLKAGHFDSRAFFSALAVGLFAQLIDGALGMGYGVTSNSLLLASGFSPAAATATVHVAKAFTGAASGLAHWERGNIDTRVFRGLLIPGIIGSLLGVWLVTSIDGRVMRPYISAYLAFMGLFIIYRAFRQVALAKTVGKRIIPVALVGGFADSVGGGGWGPVVTTSLIGSGLEPKTTIGSVNAAEFVVTLASGLSFAVLIGVQAWESATGLILGGMIIAPFAAGLANKINRRALMVMVGLLIISLSAFSILSSIAD